MKGIFIIIVTVFVLAQFIPTTKRQAISVSLAECSVIMDVLETTISERGKSEAQIEEVRILSDAFMEASYVQAQKEGQNNKYVESKLPELEEFWRD